MMIGSRLVDKLTSRIRSGVWRLNQKVNPVGQVLIDVQSGGGKDVYPDIDLSAHLKVYLVNVWCYRVTREIAQRVSSVPLILQRRQINRGAITWQSVDNKEIQRILDEPNPNEDWRSFTERQIVALLGAGNAYGAYVEDDHEFWYLRPDRISGVVDADGNLVKYQFRNTRRIDLERDTIVHLKLQGSTGDYFGVPPSSTIKETVMAKLNMTKYLNQFFKNFAMIGTTLSTPGKLSTLQRTAMHKEMKELFTGLERAFGTAILEGGTKLDKLTHPLKELIPTELDVIARGEVIAAYGGYPVIAGLLDGASYANANVQERLFEAGTCEYIRSVFERGYTRQWLRPRWGEEYRLWYDRTMIEGLQEDRTAKSTRVISHWEKRVITLDETRLQLGYPALGPGNGGDEYYTSPLVSFNGGSFDGDDPTGGGEKQTRARKRLALAVDPLAVKWLNHDRQVAKGEKRLSPMVDEYLDRQRERVIDAINELTAKGKIMSRLGFAVFPSLTKDSAADVFNAELFNLIRENLLLVGLARKTYPKVVKAQGDDALKAIGVSFGFDIDNARVDDMIRRFAQKITVINNTTKELIRDVLKEAYDENLTIDQLVARLRDADTFVFSKTRAETIARTETNGIVNSANILAFQQSGVVKKKEWVSTLDERVRDIHAEANGEIVDVDAPFIVGGEAMDHPGDPAGSPENTCNCRCGCVPVIETAAA